MNIKLRQLIKEFSGVGGCAGLGVSVNGDQTQAEPGVSKYRKSPVILRLRRKNKGKQYADF